MSYPVWHFQFALIHGPNIPGSYAILLFTASNLASITSHIHNWVLFLLWLHHFILFWVILHWSPVAYCAPTDLGSSSSVSYLFAFSYCSRGSQGKNTEVVCHSLLQWTTFCQNSPPWPICLEQPYMAWLSFIELDKTVVHVIRLASFLWLWFQSVCPLMPSLRAYCLTGVSVTLDLGYLFTAAPAKYTHCSWHWTWGISSLLPLLTLDVGYLLTAAAPDLGRGVAPLSCSWLQRHAELKFVQNHKRPPNSQSNLEKDYIS